MLWFGPQSRYNEDIWEARLSRPNPGKGSPTTESSEQSALLLGLFGRCWQAVSSSKGHRLSQDATNHRAWPSPHPR